MSVGEILYRMAVSYSLTIFYSFTTLLLFGVNYLKNPFRNPWAQKLRLLPPSRLQDPKYGVHKYIKVNHGTKLHYVESGDSSKPLMVFLHGFPEFWYSWRHQIMEFQKSYRCVAVDQRGYGDSEKPEGVNYYKIELLVEDIRDLIQQLGAKKVILVSHDWGGLVACRFRDLYPDTLHACIMLSSTSREAWFKQVWSDKNQMLKSWYVFFFRMPCLPELLVLMNDMKMYDEIMLQPGNEATDKDDIECFKYWFGKPYALTPPINYYRANLNFSMPATLHKENVPFLVAIGEKDDYLDRSLLDAMKEHYTTIETVVLDNARHCMQQEEPGRINELIKNFLAKNNLQGRFTD